MKGSFKAAVVGVALASHLTKMYFVGATRDQWLCGYSPNLGSILFTLAVALLLAEQNLLPKTHCPLPTFFVRAYFLLAVIFMTSMALLLIWLPLSNFVVELNLKMASVLCGINTMRHPPLSAIIKFLECPNFQQFELFALAALILWVVVNATGAYERLVCLFNLLIRGCQDEACHEIITISDPCEFMREDTPQEIEEEEVPRPTRGRRRM